MHLCAGEMITKTPRRFSTANKHEDKGPTADARRQTRIRLWASTNSLNSRNLCRQRNNQVVNIGVSVGQRLINDWSQSLKPKWPGTKMATTSKAVSTLNPAQSKSRHATAAK
jgi:hypothetical protein